MLKLKTDWLAVTIKPQDDVVSLDFVHSLMRLLHIECYQEFFEVKGGGEHYSYTMRYNGICFKVPFDGQITNTGFGLEFTGQGLDFYLDFRRHLDEEYSEKKLLATLFALETDGKCKVNTTRIDIAADDIDYEEKKHYLLDLDRIERALRRHEICSTFKTSKRYDKFKIDCTVCTSEKKRTNEYTSRTIYLGNRKSNVCCRFYDKYAERKDKGYPVDEGIVHWSRMEFEFKHENAQSVAVSLVTLTPDDFSGYMASIFNRYVCFVVVPKNIDKQSALENNNMHRFAPKKWWSEFIGTVMKSRLYYCKPVENAYRKARKWFDNNVGPTMYSLLCCEPLDEFFYHIKVTALEKLQDKHIEIQRAYIRDKEELQVDRGSERFKQFTDDYENFIAEIVRCQAKNDVRRMLHDLDPSQYSDVLDSIDNEPTQLLLKYSDYQKPNTFLSDMEYEEYNRTYKKNPYVQAEIERNQKEMKDEIQRRKELKVNFQ